MQQDAGPAMTQKARKGDLILVETVTHDSYSVAAHAEAKAAGRELPRERVSYEYGRVASATREGYAKTWYSLGYSDELVSTYAQPLKQGTRRWVVSSKDIDVIAVLTAAKKHHWNGHPGQPKPFDTLKEATEVARPFRSTT